MAPASFSLCKAYSELKVIWRGKFQRWQLFISHQKPHCSSVPWNFTPTLTLIYTLEICCASLKISLKNLRRVLTKIFCYIMDAILICRKRKTLKMVIRYCKWAEGFLLRWFMISMKSTIFFLHFRFFKTFIIKWISFFQSYYRDVKKLHKQGNNLEPTNCPRAWKLLSNLPANATCDCCEVECLFLNPAYNVICTGLD